jgi:hypothetical protein
VDAQRAEQNLQYAKGLRTYAAHEAVVGTAILTAGALVTRAAQAMSSHEYQAVEYGGEAFGIGLCVAGLAYVFNSARLYRNARRQRNLAQITLAQM